MSIPERPQQPPLALPSRQQKQKQTKENLQQLQISIPQQKKQQPQSEYKEIKAQTTCDDVQANHVFKRYQKNRQ